MVPYLGCIDMYVCCISEEKFLLLLLFFSQQYSQPFRKEGDGRAGDFHGGKTGSPLVVSLGLQRTRCLIGQVFQASGGPMSPEVTLFKNKVRAGVRRGTA